MFDRETRIISPLFSVFHPALLDVEHWDDKLEERYREIMLRWREDGRSKRMTPEIAALNAKQDFCDWYRRDVWTEELGEWRLEKMAKALEWRAVAANEFDVTNHLDLLRPYWRQMYSRQKKE